MKVQWLRLCTSNAGGMGLIPGWGTKIPHAAQHSQKKKRFHLLPSPWISWFLWQNDNSRLKTDERMFSNDAYVLKHNANVRSLQCYTEIQDLHLSFLTPSPVLVSLCHVTEDELFILITVLYYTEDHYHINGYKY